MNLIRRHKGLALVGGLTLILIIIIFIIFANMIFSNGDSVYGNRLKGIAKVDKNVIETIIDETTELDEVEEVDIRIQGKIIYTTVIYKEGTNLDKAKSIATDTLAKYKEEVIEDYDFGYFLKENVEIPEDASEEAEQKTGFVVAGTKHPKSESISWTNS